MVHVLGLDIGGANTKAAYVSSHHGKVSVSRVAIEYFPVWKEPNKLTAVLLKLKRQLRAKALEAVGVTMTAELSDAYQTKREGVNHILRCVQKAFPNLAIYVLNTNAELESIDTANRGPLGVAAANWAATGWLVGKYVKDCIIVDVGSTSTSIIPLVGGRLAACGKTDLDKLMCGELVYTGSLRTNVAAIVQSIPVRGGTAKVASELFALSGDVHLALGNINETQYNSETADGRGKTVEQALARLARVICADTEMLSKQEIINIAGFIYGKQLEQIAEGLLKVYERTKPKVSGKLPVVVTGLGKEFLARRAAEMISCEEIIDSSSLLPAHADLATPAYGVALVTSARLEGEKVG